ncbi:MAG: porin family protein [Candidatus Krumholzibacteria bacterium]|nr:porin family protein [Candidatus Krumholzibacteria bacterium]
MKSRVLLVGVILLFCFSANAQLPAVGITGKGVKLGVAFATISTDYDELDDFLDSRGGFIGGAYLTYSLSRQFALQPEILYVAKGGEKDFFFVAPYWSSDYLEFPLLLKFSIVPAGPIHPILFVGPAVSFLLSSEVGVSSYSYDVKDGMKSVDFSVVFGGGIDFKRFTFDVRYTMGLVNAIDADKINRLTGAEPNDYFYLEGDPSVENANFSVMIGVRF